MDPSLNPDEVKGIIPSCPCNHRITPVVHVRNFCGLRIQGVCFVLKKLFRIQFACVTLTSLVSMTMSSQIDLNVVAKAVELTKGTAMVTVVSFLISIPMQ